MNPSDWIKAAALVTQQKQEAATAETDQLISMPLSQIAMDDTCNTCSALQHAHAHSNKHAYKYRCTHV